MKKRSLALLLAIVAILSAFSFCAFATDEQISVYVEGELLNFDVPPQMINDRTMVPMRTIFEALHASVDWDDGTQTITATKGDTKIIMQINNKTVVKNTERIHLDVAPVVIDDRALVPVRAVAESLGVTVFWHGDISSVSIYQDDKEMQYVWLYNLNGEQVKIEAILSNAYKSIGWSDDMQKVTTKMYAPDGTTQSVFIAQIPSKQNAGWSLTPVCTMYATDGRTVVIDKTEVEAYKNAGWYETKEEVLQNIYSLSGVKVVYKDEVDAYVQQGWRTWPFPITLTEMCSYEENSVNGITLAWLPKNTSGKTINYYDVTLYFVNPVGDPAYDEITDNATKRVSYVGPCLPDKALCIYSLVGYVPACDRVVIGEVELKYADGTSEAFWCGQTAKEGNILSKWDGTMMYK